VSALGSAAGSAASLLAKSPWELLGGSHGGAVELQSAAARDGAAHAAKETAGALRVIGRAGVVRTWLRLDAAGEASTLHLDKHGIAQRCSVPLRDLRVLEPGLTTRHVHAFLRFFARPASAPRPAPRPHALYGDTASPRRCCAASARW
jgi:hypothetical protein